MARNPETVWEFEKNLINKVREKGKLDHDEVLAIKRTHTGNDSATVVHNWEYRYYENILKKEKYQVDAQEVKKYFELGNVLEGMFKITQTLFGVKLHNYYRYIKENIVMPR